MALHLLSDLRWAARYGRRRPIFAAAVVLTLGVTIAAATTAVGLAASVLWRPLPFDDASRLVFAWESVDGGDGQPTASRVTGYRYARWRDEAGHVFASLAMFAASALTLETPDGAESIRGVRASAGYFDTLGIRPLRGRTFTRDDETPGRHRVIVLSHAFWRERFGGRDEVVGQTLRLSGSPYTVIGVMPPVVFPGWPVNPATVTLDPEARQFWVPLARTPELDQNARSHLYGVVGRLATGVSAAEAIERLDRTSHAAAPDRHRAHLTPLREQFVRDARTPLLALIGAAIALLVIACTNVATLFVSAFEARRAEMAIRAALGAGRARLVRQLAAEAVVLGGAGAGLGLLLSHVSLSTVPSWLPTSIPFLTTPGLDLTVSAVAIALALFASVLFAAWPIGHMWRASPAPRGMAAPSRSRVYRVLVVSQIAITFALAVAAALLMQSLQSVRQADPGFTLDRVFVADVGLQVPAGATAADIAARERAALAEVARLPGVRGAAVAYDHPLEANWSENPIIVGDTTAPDRRRGAELRIVSPEYFDTMEVAVLEGRAFTVRDDWQGRGVAMINEAFAREIGGNAIGRTLRTGTPRFRFGDTAIADFEIVGVVHNERVRGLEGVVDPAFYLSTLQFPQESLALLVRTEAPPMAITRDVRLALRQLDSAITVSRPRSLDAILGEQMVTRRVTSDVVGGFAGAGILLAVLGMYSLLAIRVSSRAREIGVRLAIGASPRVVARQIVADSIRTVLLGAACGAVLALLAGRLIRGVLVGVSAYDPMTLTLVAALLMGVGLLAALVPALRAASIDPVVTLKAE